MNENLNGETVSAADAASLPNDWRRWLSRTRATMRLSMNTRAFDKLVAEGGLPAALKCPDGTLRWDPNIVEALAEELDGRASAADTKAEADLGKATAAQVVVSTNHTERMVALFERPIAAAVAQLRQANRDLSEDNERLRERLHLVEQARTDLITAREQLLSEQAARDIAARESAARDERKKQMFQIFAARAPGVLDALGKTLGISKGDQAKVSAVIDLANDLDPAVLEGLADAGLLSDKQLELVEVIIGKKLKRKAAADEKAGSDAKDQ